MAFPPLYLTNDDVTIRLGIEGHAVPGQPPTGFVLMTHAALASALVALQGALPSAPLWDLTLTATSLLALGTFVAVVWTTAGPTWLQR